MTNFSKGELSPLIEGRPELAAYYEGGRKIENWKLLRQGGLTRRPGLRMICKVKYPGEDTVIFPFEASVTSSFIVELGHNYCRFIKDKAQILSGGLPYEIVSPYAIDKLRAIHFTQSVDVMYLFNPDVAQRKLNHLADTNWVFTLFNPNPPPSFEADTDLSGGTITLTPGATTGSGVTFTASAAVFLAGDVGRLIIFGTARAEIITFTDTTHVVADIIDDFPNVNPIPASSWLLRLTPQTTLDPNKSKPVRTIVTLVAALACFRTADVGKYITIYGGIIKITNFDSTTQVRGTLLSTMSGTSDANPAAAPAGAWTLEVASWSVTNGYPRTGEFYQGRLAQAATLAERTKFWLSQSDDFEGYAVGILADQAIEYTMATKRLNRIEWLGDNIDMFVGTHGTAHRVHGDRDGQPIGGDIVPLVDKIDEAGCAPIQPTVVGHRVVYVDHSQKKIMSLAFNLEEDSFQPVEITAASEHIMGTGVLDGPTAYAVSPDPIIYYVTKDGELVALTYHIAEKVIGFARFVTDGLFKGVAKIPQNEGLPDQIYVVVERVINGVTEKFIELFDETAEELSGRAWTSLQTDCAKVYDLAGVPTTTLTGLDHLEGELVDVITDGSLREQQTVVSGQITLAEAASINAEVGLHYRSTVITMRPTIEGQMVEGLLRNWIKLWIRVKDAIGGTINGEPINYVPSPLDTLVLKTGDYDVTQQANPDTEGYITIVQDEPYPMTLLAVFGEIEFSPHG